MPRTKKQARSRTHAKKVTRRRRGDIRTRGSRHRDIAATTAKRPSWHMVPLLIRWPQGLLDRVDEERDHRRRAAFKKRWSFGRPKSRGQVIRELVAERLRVSDRAGTPIPVLRLNGSKKK